MSDAVFWVWIAVSFTAGAAVMVVVVVAMFVGTEWYAHRRRRDLRRRVR